MGVVKGTISGLGAVAGGVAALPFGGFGAFVVGAMAGTVTADVLWAALGRPPRTGRGVGIEKGVAASLGGAAAIPFAGLTGMMAGAFVGALLGDLLL